MDPTQGDPNPYLAPKSTLPAGAKTTGFTRAQGWLIIGIATGLFLSARYYRETKRRDVLQRVARQAEKAAREARPVKPVRPPAGRGPF